MATPVMAADGDAVDAAHFTKAIEAGDGTLNTKLWGGRVYYTGTAWAVHATTFSAGITTAGVAWSTNHINIAVSGFTTLMVCVVSPTFGATTLRPEAIAASTTQVQVQFKNSSDTVITTEATTMDCQLLIWGS